MYKYCVGLFFFCSLLSYVTGAQILPTENSKLNYRLIGFSFPAQNLSGQYAIEIAAGTFYNEDSFHQNVIGRFTGDTNRIIGEVPAFGRSYTWRGISRKGGAPVKSGLHHFSTLIGRDVDTTVTRLRVLKHAEKYADAYVFMDGAKALYDMNGKPVWYIPAINGVPTEPYNMVGDLKLTKFGTVTYLANRQGGQVYEINYNGNVVWKGPNTGQVSGDSLEHYHHEFTRLSNGHYMVMGSERVTWKLPGTVKKNYMTHPGNEGKIIIDTPGHTYYEKLEFGTLIEYDQEGKVVWSWRSKDYFRDADVFNRTQSDGTFFRKDVHANAFYFDERTSIIYVSFKNVSRILKVKYPEGKVLAAYGRKFDKGGIKGYGPDQYSFQHSCGISDEGYLYVFNNNSRRDNALPTIPLMQQPAFGGDSLKIVWEYQCTTDGLAPASKTQPEFSALGSVAELPDHSMFVCMSSSAYTKAFIVNREKQILWSAMPERWSVAEKKWMPIIQYRAGIVVNRKDLEQFIWNTEAGSMTK